MYGDFVVCDGQFDFKYGGIIQRNIEVVPGGSIVWDGAPEKANLELSALYNTEANPSVLLDNPAANRKIPVEVYVDLKGQLEQPELKFRIEFPRVSSTLKSELNYKLQAEEQRQNQALFLLASGSFVNDNYAGSNAFAGTVADRVSGLVKCLFRSGWGELSGIGFFGGGKSACSQEGRYCWGFAMSTQICKNILISEDV